MSKPKTMQELIAENRRIILFLTGIFLVTVTLITFSSDLFSMFLFLIGAFVVTVTLFVFSPDPSEDNQLIKEKWTNKAK
jgi:RsiW-degrading membrane proteinase PrsW (M82 family)